MKKQQKYKGNNHLINCMNYFLTLLYLSLMAQLAVAVKYTDCIFVEG